MEIKEYSAGQVKEYFDQCLSNESSYTTADSVGEGKARTFINSYEERVERRGDKVVDSDDEPKPLKTDHNLTKYNPLIHKTILPIGNIDTSMLFALLEAMLSDIKTLNTKVNKTNDDTCTLNATVSDPKQKVM